MGYKVRIVIDCEEPEEIGQHLQELRSQIRKHVAKSPEEYQADGNTIHMYDNNCYGTHDCEIKVK